MLCHVWLCGMSVQCKVGNVTV